MPIGLFILFFLSLVTYRRCRASSRRATVWVPLMWVFVTAIGLAVPTALAVVVEFNDPEITEERLVNFLMIPTVIGMLAGAALGVWLAGRPTMISYESRFANSDSEPASSESSSAVCRDDSMQVNPYESPRADN